MMAAGGFDDPQTVTHITRQPIADVDTVADNASTGDNQASCGLLLVSGVAIREAIWSRECEPA
jgi:hypothetical protein